jgi:hypothetical protein
MPENRRKTGESVPGGEATRWKPGQSGNPGGRPKTADLSHACRELIPDSPIYNVSEPTYLTLI